MGIRRGILGVGEVSFDVLFHIYVLDLCVVDWR